MKHILASVLAVLAVISETESRTISNLAKQNAPSLPSHNLATPKFSSWLSAFNTADRDTILSFYATNFSGYDSGYNETTCFSPSISINSPCIDIHMASWTGGFALVDIEASANDSSLIVLLKEKNRPRYHRASVVVDEKPEHLVTEIDLLPVMTPLRMISSDDPRRKTYEKGLQPLTKELREKLVQEIARLLRDEYVYPQQGEAMIKLLEENLKNGEYDSFDNSEKFSWQLNNDMGYETTTSNDVQLFVFFHEPPLESEAEKEDQQKDEHFRRIQYGFGNVSFDTDAIPQKTIATLPIPQLLHFGDPGVREAIAEKMNSVADADVLILDLRNSLGLDSETAAFVLSYLFDEPRRLTYSLDRYDTIQNSSSTLPVYQLPEDAKTFGGEKPIYVLTNNRTIYQAEAIAYSLQAYDRGTIVGEQETTAGWANVGSAWFPICEEEFGKVWWSVYVQNRRLIHEATKASWEGTGVKSDLKPGWIGGEAKDHVRESAIAFEKSRLGMVREVQQEL